MAQQYPSEIASSYYPRQQAADFYATHLPQGRNTVLARFKAVTLFTGKIDPAVI